VYLEAMGDAWATLGLCMFLMFGLLPAGESALSPHGSIAPSHVVNKDVRRAMRVISDKSIHPVS